MTIGSSTRRLVLGGLVSLFALGACSYSPSPRLFTLAARPVQPVGKFVGTISVKRVELAKYLDRLEIVQYSNPYELKLSEYNLWGEDLADMATRVLIESLAGLLPGSQVYPALGALTVSTPDLALEVNISRFELDPGGDVVLAAQWVAHRKGQSDQLRSAQFHVKPSSNDTTAQVAAMSDALSQLAVQIAKGVVG
jgi:uncharacterized lipoprotein YmbA